MYKYIKSNERFVLSVDNHEEIVEALTAFAREQGVTAGQVSGLGAVCEATFRLFDPVTKQFVDKTFREQMEIVNLTGNFSVRDNGEPYLHVHLICSRADYSCVGGPLLSARINGACELLVDKLPGVGVGRTYDPETGLNLYKF